MRVIFLAIGCAATLLATLYAKWLSVEHDVQGKIALILVDVQRDFMDDGPVPVRGALALLPIWNELLELAGGDGPIDHAIATADWHPKDHISFVSSHKGVQLGDQIHQCAASGQAGAGGCHNIILFNSHCVAGSLGAQSPDGLATDRLDHTVRKGTLPDVESYSGLFDLGHTHPTGLVELLRARRVTTLVVAGVATDYCVLYTVLDALEEGFQVFLVLDGCAGISAEAVHAALDRMQAAGAVLVSLRGREGDHGAPSLLTELERARGKVHPGSQREL
uniref:nicotinamidase n=1 Tax=Auxenochlorella protothecoides TaxID=3075 RepID=A0A1D2AEU7_AUXPR